MPDYRSQGFSVSHPLAESKRKRKRKIATVVDDLNVAYMCLCAYMLIPASSGSSTAVAETACASAFLGSCLSHSWRRAGQPAKMSDGGGNSVSVDSRQFRQFPI